MATRSSRLRAITYLAPGLPLELFEHLARHLARTLGLPVELESETRWSGPVPDADDPFTAGEADLGFLCSPSYLDLACRERPVVDLVPAGFVFGDPRGAGRPVYFSDVVVCVGHSARSLEDLRGCVWGFNDECSLSGCLSMVQALAERDAPGFFAREVRTGSHHASLEALAAGTIDCATIDSTALLLARRTDAERLGGLRTVESFGPFPIQPVVVRSEAGPALRDAVAGALVELDRERAPWMEHFALRGFVPIDGEAYEEERRALVRLGRLPG